MRHVRVPQEIAAALETKPTGTMAESIETQLDSALLKAHYRFQHGCFVSEHQDSHGGILAYSDFTPIPMWNHAAWTNSGDPNFNAFLQNARAWQSAKNRCPVVYLSAPHDEQLQLLQEQNFLKFDEEAWMVASPNDFAWKKSNAVTEVQDQQSLDQFIDTFSASFQIKESGYRRALVRNASQGPVRSRHFVLYDDARRPVSVGTLITDGQFACLYNVGTPAEQRGKGYGGRIFQHIAALAVESGCKTLFLQVENNSNAKRLYEKNGFHTAFVRAGFRLKDWQPGRAQRTRLSNLLGFKPSENHVSRYLRETRALGQDISPALKRQTNPHSRENAFLAAWAFLLHRYTGEDSATFTVSDHNRNSRRALSITVDPFATVQSWINRLPQADPQSETEAAESFLCLNRPSAPSHLEDHQFPLELHLVGDAEAIEIIFRSDLFSKDAIRRMSAHFATILQFIARNPMATVGEIELLSPSEKRQLLVDWNQSSFQPVHQSLVQLFEAQVERAPEATALVFAKTGESQPLEELTYRQLNRRANRLAHRLQELGVSSDVFVGVCLDRSLDMIVALIAVLKAGGACVPLDPAYPAERIRFMLQDTGAPLILTQKHLQNFLRETTNAKLICIDSLEATARSENEKNPNNRATASSAAYVIYTSGSTGQPKGVVIPNHAITNHSVDCKAVYGLSPRDRVLQFSSFNFDASFEQILPALISGAALVLRDNEVWNTREFAEKLRQLQLTVADIPTAYWHQLATEWSKNPEAVPPNALRLMIVGGEALSPEKLALWHRTPLAPVRLINAYGPTETTITATSYEVPQRQPAETDRAVLPIGRPRGGRKLYVVDRFGNPAPVGVPGELLIGGSMLARGYHRRGELTASRFIPNPFSDEPDERLYRTGDLVRYLEDGNLEFLGRLDDQVKVRGFRIELGEIETCLCKHSAVEEAIVLARTFQGSSENRLIAYVTKRGEKPDAAELRNFLKTRLPEYMLPHAFVILDAWPLMPNGKVDRRALPEPTEEKHEQNIKGPESPLELQLQVIFERVLKIGPISVDASFFELGGDSLQALELLVEIETATGKQLPLGTLYQSSTVESIAREIQSRASDAPWSSLVPLQTSGKRPPFFLLHTTPGDILGYGNLVYRLDPDQPCYGLQSLGLKEASLSHTSVEEMARFYVERMREFQPHGPYYLGGWCYGGIVAVEMSRLLQEQGEAVGLLALLETVAMPSEWTNLPYYLHRLRCFAKMSPERWLSYFRAKARYARESRIANKMRFRQADNSADGEIRDPRLLKLEHVYNTNLAALKNYRTRPFHGRVTLFNAQQRDAALIPDPQYGWVGLAREIEVHEVPGDHDTMLTEPNVTALAQRLNQCLLRAQAEHKSEVK